MEFKGLFAETIAFLKINFWKVNVENGEMAQGIENGRETFWSLLQILLRLKRNWKILLWEKYFGSLQILTEYFVLRLWMRLEFTENNSRESILLHIWERFGFLKVVLLMEYKSFFQIAII